MKTLVFGASGATGKLAVMQLIKKNIPTRILVRESAVLPEEVVENNLVETIYGNVNELDQAEMTDLLMGGNVIISCLGHNISFKGLFGHPHYLVLDAIKGITEAVRKNTEKKIKLILMSTTAYTNTLCGGKNSAGEKIVLSLLTALLPPHRDNIRAADYLIKTIGSQNELIEWVAVRPDTLIDEAVVSEYYLSESPVRSPVFDAGKTSRINVGHFIASLASDEELWKKWVYETPVIYNKDK